MSRSGYSDDLDNWSLIRWRGAVASALRGERGQKLLREMAEAMDAMPDKALISGDLELEGAYCALGTVGAKRGVDMTGLDPYDRDTVAAAFDIAPCLAAEVAFVNDEGGGWRGDETPTQRWVRVRAWVTEQLARAVSPRIASLPSSSDAPGSVAG